MGRPLVDSSVLRTEGSPWGADEDALGRAIDAASATIERECRRLILTATTTQFHSGDRAASYRDEQGRYGTRLYLQDHTTGFYTLPVTGITSVAENGTSLTVIRMPYTVAPSDTANAVLILDRVGVAVRASVSGGLIVPCAWATGLANIKVTSVVSGWAADAIPDDIRQAVTELALLYMREGRRSGTDTLNVEGSSIGYTRTLTPKTRDVIALYNRRLGPTTLEG